MPTVSQPTAKPAPPRAGDSRLPGLFAGLLGVFLGLLLLKFGNPPIMEKWVAAPKDAYEFLLGYPWPIGWAYVLLGGLVLLGFRVARWQTPLPKWLLSLPLAWLFWQYAASAQTTDAEMSRLTNLHFTAAVLCFYLGLFCLGKVQSLRVFCFCLFCGFLLVLAEGWQQHFGGLRATKTYFFLYVYPQMRDIPPEYLKKLSSERIFSTLFYPNTLAGALLLLLPVMLTFLWQLKHLFTPAARGFLIAAVSLGASACLFWSGSKGGWLLMLLLGLITLLHLPFSRKHKHILVAVVLAAGLAGFFWKYAGFFEKGATSVGARFDYWEAAVKIAANHPLFGTGPGTFGSSYAKIKRPDSEPSRLTHNDYLQQAADSGILGCVFYTVFIAGGLYWTYPGFPRGEQRSPESSPAAISVSGEGPPSPGLRYAIWLGVLGWALQSLMDFGLYIPALGWVAMSFLGWLAAQGTRAKPS